MTPQKVLTIDLKEIPNLQITCTCGGLISFPLPKDDPPTYLACPSCNTALWLQGEDKARTAVLGLMRSLSKWKLIEHEGFKLGFCLTEKE